MLDYVTTKLVASLNFSYEFTITTSIWHRVKATVLI